MDNYNYDWNNFRPLILCITILCCFATGLIGLYNACLTENGLGVIGSAIAFGSVLFYLKKKQ